MCCPHQYGNVVSVVVGEGPVPRQQMTLALLVDVVEGGVQLQQPQLPAGDRQQGGGRGGGGQALLILHKTRATLLVV